jgi:hypothetical protein
MNIRSRSPTVHFWRNLRYLKKQGGTKRAKHAENEKTETELELQISFLFYADTNQAINKMKKLDPGPDFEAHNVGFCTKNMKQSSLTFV